MTDLPQARPVCDHSWAYHVYDGLSVRLCQLCHEPDWEDVRGELAAAAAAERERIRRLAIEWKASYWATKDTPGGRIDMEFPFADLLTGPEGGQADGT